MKEAVECGMQVLDVHKKFCQIIVCTKEGEIIRKGKIRTNEKEIRKFFYGLKNVKVAIADAKIKSDKIDAKILAV